MEVIPARSDISLYADDLAVRAQDVCKEAAARRVEEAVQRIADWSRRVKLRLNADKYEVGFFSSSTREAGHQPVVMMDGKRLGFNATPVFLGVTYDRCLSFRPQVKKVCSRVAAKC